MYWNIRVLRRGTSPGKLFLTWKKEEDKFIEGDHTYSRSLCGDIDAFNTYSWNKSAYTIVVEWNYLKVRYEYGDLDVDGTALSGFNCSRLWSNMLLCAWCWSCSFHESHEDLDQLSNSSMFFSWTDAAPWIAVMGLRLKFREHVTMNAT